MNINEYINLNLDKNEMATQVVNLQQTQGYYPDMQANASGTQMMDNLIQQMEQMPQTQPMVISGQAQSQMVQQPQIAQQPQMTQQPQMVYQPQQMGYQQQQMGYQQQQPQQMNQQPIFVPQNTISEKSQAIKDLEISSSESILEEKKPEEKKVTPTKKSFTGHLNDTIMVVILYMIISNPYITPQLVKFVPFFETYPWALFGLKVLVFGILFHLIKWFI